jgi:rhamnulose-1-phosphate aldolase
MIKINTAVKNEIENISEVAGYLWDKGWCERNAGNISFDFTGLMNISGPGVADCPCFTGSFPLDCAGLVLFVTGTGERLRDLISNPEKAACILVIDSDAKGYHIIWGAKSKAEFRPTSEFASHLAIHLFNKKVQNNNRCVIHTHPVELIALSHHPTLGHDERALNKALWSMLPEVRVYLPKGVSIAPYELPGSENLAKLTIKGLELRDVVIWSKHGALATGINATEAFDYIDVANKGALIYLKCLEAGYTPEGISDQNLKDLEKFL